MNPTPNWDKNQFKSRASPEFQLHPEASAAEHPRFGEEKLSLGFGSSKKSGKKRTKLLPGLPECPGGSSCPWECFPGGLIPVFWGAAGLGCAAAAPRDHPLAVANPEAKSRPSLEIKLFQLWNKRHRAPAALWSLCLGGVPGDIRCLLSPSVAPGDSSCASLPSPRAGHHSLKSILGNFMSKYRK